MEEIWKTTPLIEGFYEVSNLGRVRRSQTNSRTFAGRIRKPWPNNKGYLVVSLSIDGREVRQYVHRLVCEAFHGKPPQGKEAHHKNANPLDNRPENLEWVSHKENIQECAGRISAGLIKRQMRGSAHPRAILNEKQVFKIREALDAGVMGMVLAEKYGVNWRTISAINHRKLWRHVA